MNDMSSLHIQVDVVGTQPQKRDAMIIIHRPEDNQRDMWVLIESAGEYTDGGGSARVVDEAVKRINKLFASGKQLPVSVYWG